jgi:hypothetical protein
MPIGKKASGMFSTVTQDQHLKRPRSADYQIAAQRVRLGNSNTSPQRNIRFWIAIRDGK